MAPLSTEGGAEQRSAMWHAERAGSATGSRFADCVAFKKDGKETAARRDYRLQCVVERLTGIPKSSFSTKPMERGQELEPEARTRYEMATNNDVELIGFVNHPEIEWCGVSVDGLVDEDGTIEIKCPNPETHMATLMLRSEALAKVLLGEAQATPAVLVPEEHMPQIQGGLWVTGRKWCDFISYDPRFPKHLQLYIERVYRDEAYIAKLEAGVRKFLEEVEEAVTMILGVDAASAAPDAPAVNDIFSAMAGVKAAVAA